MLGVASYRPDLAATNPGIASGCKNVRIIRDGNGIAHAPQQGLGTLASATALPAFPRGGSSYVTSGGTYIAFIGTVSNIYQMSASYELDAGQSVGSGYSLAAGDNWSFGRFKEYALATNRSDGLQKFDVNNDSAFSSVSGSPLARYGFPAFNSYFLLDCDGENRVMRNSAIGDPLTWTVGEKGAGFRTIPDGEELMCGAELSPDFAIVLQRNAVRGLNRRSDGQLYDVVKLFSGRGAINPDTFCHADGICWWYDTDGFYEYSLANGLRNISEGKISTTFQGLLHQSGAAGLQMEIDKVNHRVMVRYRSQNCNSADVYDDVLTYDYVLEEWMPLEVSTAFLLQMASPGYTLDDMGPFGPLDSIDIPLDSRFWSGGESRISAINSDLKFATFDGDSLEAVSFTQEYDHNTSISINAVTPLTDAANATVSTGVRDAIQSAVSFGAEKSIQPSGRVTTKARGQFLQFRTTIPAGESWTFHRGFLDIQQARAGGRK